MTEAQTLQFLNGVILRTTGQEATITSYRPVPGGCINNGLRVNFQSNGREKSVFLKWNSSAADDFFSKEALGLQLLEKQAIFSIPSVLGSGFYMGRHYLVLSHLNSVAPAADFWQNFGEQLATLHQQTEDVYGLAYDNYIGKLPQKNKKFVDWIDFFIENRLEAQLGLARYNQYVSAGFTRKFRLLYAQLPGILAAEPPSLLHGDLWSGNFLTDEHGDVALIDPAVYYGNREIEIAFTQLFGGFDRQFYRSYNEVYPLQPGFSERAEIYNLYPLLVHVNLFGQSYLSGIEATLRKFL